MYSINPFTAGAVVDNGEVKIADVVEELKSDGIEVLTVNLFAENRLNGIHGADGDNDEQRDFSIRPGEEIIATTLADRMKRLDVSLSGFAFAHDLAK